MLGRTQFDDSPTKRQSDIVLRVFRMAAGVLKVVERISWFEIYVKNQPLTDCPNFQVQVVREKEHEIVQNVLDVRI